MAYRIGEVARRVGMTVEGLRFYERAGLVKPRRRTRGGYRLYSDEQIDTLRFVRAAQEMGFSLAEIRELLQLRRGTGSCAAVRDRLLDKLGHVRQRIRLLRAFERQLDAAVARCERQLGSHDEARCPVLEELGRSLDGTARGGGERRESA